MMTSEIRNDLAESSSDSETSSDDEIIEVAPTPIRTTWTERHDSDALAYICSHEEELRQYLPYDPDDTSYDPLCIPRKILAKSRGGLLEVEYFQPTEKGRFYAKGSLGQQSMARQIPSRANTTTTLISSTPTPLSWNGCVRTTASHALYWRNTMLIAMDS